ncbi:MAG: hypothetical protein ACKOED_02570 [Aestuariivirga sp.]
MPFLYDARGADLAGLGSLGSAAGPVQAIELPGILPFEPFAR